MSNIDGLTAPRPASGPPPQALDGVRTRRVFAFLIDIILISTLFVALFFLFAVLGFATFGLAWLVIPILYSATAFFYNGLLVSGPRLSTWGMRAMDLEVRMMDGTPPPFINAAAHAVLFYICWTALTPLVLLVSLFTRDKRCLHDIGAGVIVTRSI